MIASAFRNFYWGFFLIMVDFRIGGLEILPDVIGYILLASGLSTLASQNEWFMRARGYVWPAMILSVFQLYERPAESSGVHIIWGSGMTLILGLAMAVLSLLAVYNLFMGIREMASRAGNPSIADEALSKWNQYLGVAVAGLLSFILAFIPVIGFPLILSLFVVNLVLAVGIMRLMRRCETELGETTT